MMATTIWKFPLKAGSFQRVEMPGGAEVLSAGVQGGVVHVWAVVNDSAPMWPRQFHVVPTGGDVPTSTRNRFIGTVFDGPFVWHVFDAGPAHDAPGGSNG